MSEIRNKKSSSGKPYKKESGGFRGKRTSLAGAGKQKREYTNDKEGSDSKPKKRFERTNTAEKPVRSGKRRSELVPKIKKSFSDHEHEIKSKSYREKPSGPGIKSKKPFKKEWEDKDKPKTYKKDYKSGDKKFSTTENEKGYKTGNKPFRKDTAKRVTVKENSGSEGPGPIRLNRYIAASGICSRREADEMIKIGEVKVNGELVTEMGTKVNPTDRVEVGGQSITPERKVYILMNKPKDVVSTVSDPHADRTVIDLIKHAGPERVYPVGRLDKSTTGVLLLTNDGELTKKLTHPGYNKKKVYHVVLDQPATKAQLQQIAEGFVLEDGFIHADAISFVKEGDHSEIGIELHSGRNRIVRRIFEHLGLTVIKLDRVYFAGLTKKNLPRGKWRYLNDKEIGMLKRGAYE